MFCCLFLIASHTGMFLRPCRTVLSFAEGGAIRGPGRRRSRGSIHSGGQGWFGFPVCLFLFPLPHAQPPSPRLNVILAGHWVSPSQNTPSNRDLEGWVWVDWVVVLAEALPYQHTTSSCWTASTSWKTGKLLANDVQSMASYAVLLTWFEDGGWPGLCFFWKGARGAAGDLGPGSGCMVW